MATLDISGLTAWLEKLKLGPIPQFSEAHVLDKPLDIGRSYLAGIFHRLTNCDSMVAYNSIQWPNDIFTADLTVPLPKLSQGADPTAFAIDLMQRFPSCPLFILPLREGVHLRILFMPKTLCHLLLPYINDRKDTYGKHLSIGLHDPSTPALGRKKLFLEFSSPNIATEFHGKHLRSTILGTCIANLYENMGWDVVKVNYLGDWGKHIGLLGIGWERFGSDEQFQIDPIGHMLDVYSQIDLLFQPEQAASRAARDGDGDPAAIETQGLFAERNLFFKRMEDGDEKTIALWKRFREVSVEHYTRLYARMNVSFDEYSGESQISPDTMAEVEDILKSKGISEESDQSLIVDLKKHTGKSGRFIIRDRNGSRTYHLRELAAVLERFRKYSFDKMIYVVADDHDSHFPRIITILELMGMSDLAHKLQHVHFNKSSQMLETITQEHTLSEILDQCQAAMHKSLKDNPEKGALLGDTDESAAAIGISALVAQEMWSKRASNHVLDFKKMTSFERGTGPELQYWYARLCSIIKAAKPDLSVLSDEDFNPVEDETYSELLRILAQYPDVTNSAYKSLEPSIVMHYLVNITDQLSACIETEEGPETSSYTPAEAAFFEIVRQVLENGMKLLGIVPVIGQV